MKTIKYLIPSCLLAATTACVDLDQKPNSFLTEEDYIELPQSIATVELAATGLVNNLWSENYGYCCRMMRIDCAADQLVSAPKPNNSLDYIIDLNPSLGANSKDWQSLWSNFWKVITGANKLLTGTPLPSDPEEAEAYRRVLAEAHFLRALSYFHLVRIFGDVPLITSPQAAIEQQDRVAVALIYDEIIVPDIEFAVKHLPTTSRSGYSSTPSQWAAKTLQADILMTMAGWPLNKGTSYYQKAADITEEIILNAGLSLTTNYADLWKEDKKQESNEHLYAIHNSVLEKMASQYGKSFYPRDFAPKSGWADYYANPAYLEEYPEGPRKEHNFMLEWNTKAGVISWEESMDKRPCVAKYYDYNQGVAGNSAQSNGITPIYRYADVLLMYAEASNLATGSVNELALSSLQMVQQRAGAPLTTTIDSQAFDDAVFAETGYEFLAEFKRWFDLVRREKVTLEKGDLFNSSLFKANKHYYFPIDAQEIQLTGWENNPGY